MEYGAGMADAVECVWEEAGEDRPFDKDILLLDASFRTTIVGFLRYEPAGYLQLGMQPGRISLICAHPGCRRAGLGTQLIGQAIMLARASGCPSLSVSLSLSNPHREFFIANGFTPEGEQQEGREILVKDIRFDPDSPQFIMHNA